MCAIQLTQDESLIRQVQVAAWSPFTALIEDGAQFGIDGVWLLVQVLADFEFELYASSVTHVPAITDLIDRLTGKPSASRLID